MAKQNKSIKKKNGRPFKLNQDIVNKLEQSASLDCSISEMCFYADISRETYYNWSKTNKKLIDRLESLRNKPILAARQSVVNGLKDNPEFALKYLERKLPDEFALKTKFEHTGKDGESILLSIVNFKKSISEYEKENQTQSD